MSASLHSTTQFQRSAFSWVGEIDAKKLKTPHSSITAREVAEEYGVPKKHVIGYIEAQVLEAASVTRLPWVILNVISYTWVIRSHDPGTPLQAVEHAVLHDIEKNAKYAFTGDFSGHKNLYDVTDVDGFWSWLIKGFVPLVFVQEYQWSEHIAAEATMNSVVFPPEERGYYLNYDRIVGGVRLRQEVSDITECTSEDVMPFYRKECVSGPDYRLLPEFFTSLTTTNPQREFWLWAIEDQNILLDTLVIKETDGWFDDRTRKIEIMLPLYNAQLSVYTIVYVNFFLSRGGKIWSQIVALSTYTTWWRSSAALAADSLWLLCLCQVFLRETRRMWRNVRAHGPWKFLADTTVWHLLDWISFSVGLALALMFAYRLNRTSVLNVEFGKLASINEVFEHDEYRAQARSFVEDCEQEVSSFFFFSGWCCACTQC